MDGMNPIQSPLFTFRVDQSYTEHLAKATRIAVWFNSFMLGFFTLVYLLDGFIRRYFQDHIENTPQSGATLILFDLDWFKKINDTYGHEIGDQVLKGIAILTTNSLRHNDVLIRFGGEEFVILMPETNVEGGLKIAQRLRHKIEQTAIETEKGAVRLTASFGMAYADEDEKLDVNQLIQRADHAMYSAKEAGRNRICLWRADKPVLQESVPDEG